MTSIVYPRRGRVDTGKSTWVRRQERQQARRGRILILNPPRLCSWRGRAPPIGSQAAAAAGTGKFASPQSGLYRFWIVYYHHHPRVSLVPWPLPSRALARTGRGNSCWNSASRLGIDAMPNGTVTVKCRFGGSRGQLSWRETFVPSSRDECRARARNVAKRKCCKKIGCPSFRGSWIRSSHIAKVRVAGWRIPSSTLRLSFCGHREYARCSRGIRLAKDELRGPSRPGKGYRGFIRTNEGEHSGVAASQVSPVPTGAYLRPSRLCDEALDVQPQRDVLRALRSKDSPAQRKKERLTSSQ